MSRPTPLPLPPSQDEYQLQHVAWSYMGNDLAVVDVSGRIMIYLNGITLGKMVMTRTHVHDQDDEMSAVVGLHWLPVFPHAQQVREKLCLCAYPADLVAVARHLGRDSGWGSLELRTTAIYLTWSL